MPINIAGEVHALDGTGRTLCGQRYPSSWRLTQRSISCPKCWRILEAEQAAQLAKARTTQPAPAGADIPFDLEAV